MPKGHPISVPRTWPGHRDFEPRQDDRNPFQRILAGRTMRDAYVPGCPVPDGSCLLCDDDHCREL